MLKTRQKKFIDPKLASNTARRGPSLKALYNSLPETLKKRIQLAHIKRLAKTYSLNPPLFEACTRFELPVAFVGQQEYFRQNYFDLLSNGGFEFDLKFGNLNKIKELPGFCRENNIKTCILFRPEWLSYFPETWLELKKQGVKLIGYSTEPTPTDSLDNVHMDQLLRLKSLIECMKVPYDLIVHFNQESLPFLKNIGFKKIIAYPLPISEKIFFPEETPLKHDLCFIGRSTDYRESFLGRLKATYNLIHIAHGLYDEDAAQLMRASKIVLNLHNLNYPNFETRSVQALFCNRTLFSEPLAGGYLRPEEHYTSFSTPEELFSKVTTSLSSNAWEKAQTLSREKYDFFKLSSFLKNVGFNL